MATNERCPFKHQDDWAIGTLPFLIQRKWEFPVMSALFSRGSMRYNELKRELGGVTPRALSQALDHLCAKRLLRKRVASRGAPTATYSLTPSGMRLTQLISMSLSINGQRCPENLVACPILAASQLGK